MWPLRSTVRRRSGVLWAEAIQLEPRPQRKSKSIDALKRCALGTSTAHDLTEGPNHEMRCTVVGACIATCETFTPVDRMGLCS
jgi:hypothetical protein